MYEVIPEPSSRQLGQPDETALLSRWRYRRSSSSARLRRGPEVSIVQRLGAKSMVASARSR